MSRTFEFMKWHRCHKVFNKISHLNFTQDPYFNDCLIGDGMMASFWDLSKSQWDLNSSPGSETLPPMSYQHVWCQRKYQPWHQPRDWSWLFLPELVLARGSFQQILVTSREQRLPLVFRRNYFSASGRSFGGQGLLLVVLRVRSFQQLDQLVVPYDQKKLKQKRSFKLLFPGAVVVAQLAERSLPTPEIWGSNPDIGKIVFTNCTIEKTKI